MTGAGRSRAPRRVAAVVRPLVALALLAAAVAVAVAGELPPPERVRELFAQLGGWGPAGAVVVFAAGTVLALPGVVLAGAAAYAFGLPTGLAVAVTGSTLGAAAAFGIARALGRDAVLRLTAGRERWRRIDRGVESSGAAIVLLLRLLPILPFNLLNYLLGLTGIRFSTYLGATLVGILPGAFVYCWAAVELRDVAAGGTAALARPAPWLALALLVALLVALPLAWRAADRRAGGKLLETLAARLSGRRGDPAPGAETGAQPDETTRS